MFKGMLRDKDAKGLAHTRSLTDSAAGNTRDSVGAMGHAGGKSSTPALQSSSSDSEVADAEAFVQLVKARLKAHPYLSSLSELDLKRFLVANKGSSNHALKHVQAALDWRNAINYKSILNEDFSDLEATGKLTIESTDSQQNAVMIWQQSRHSPLPSSQPTSSAAGAPATAPSTPKLSNRESKEAAQAAIDRNLRFFIYTILRAYQTHRLRTDNKLVVVIDRIGMTPANYDQPLGKAIIACMQFFPEQFEAYYVFPKNAVLMVAWKVTRVFLDPVTVARIKLLGEGEVKATLGAIIPKDELLVRYGGTKSDVYDAVAPVPAVGSSENQGAVDDDDDDQDDFVDADGTAEEMLDLGSVRDGKATPSLVTGNDSACSPTSPAPVA
ncbi:hypothetical protein BJ741DRAFT_648189 [Chytriomyces cf. hyalinus JEL632]|nr:hypothetical protein BJ741DRAFT_648189 [Chytriomyces cf. hyalinus JEL632]